MCLFQENKYFSVAILTYINFDEKISCILLFVYAFMKGLTEISI